MRSLATAFTFGTIFPVRASGTPIGRGTIVALPVVGIVLGALTALLLWIGQTTFGTHALLAGVLPVAMLTLVTRGLHIDGLADTVDGLGCYGPPDRALQVMRDGSAGPFGIAAVVLTLLMQSAALMLAPNSLAGLAVTVTAVTTGRVAALAACRRGVPPAVGSSLGARVANSQPLWVIALWVVGIAAVSIFASPRPWQGPVVVLGTVGLSAILVAHCVRRFGGITGDVLGATIEFATTLSLIGLVAGHQG
jgi:adenosylcobinamide-GDP ribazoletransferase